MPGVPGWTTTWAPTATTSWTTTTSTALNLWPLNTATTTTTTSVTYDQQIWQAWQQWPTGGYVAPQPPQPVPDPAPATLAAQELLRSLLTPDQRAELDEHHRVTVTTPAGHWYRIRCRGGWTGNVELLDDDGEGVAALCCHGGGILPAADHHAGQLLALLADEESFVGIANVYRQYGTLPDWFTAMRDAWRTGRNHYRDDDGMDHYPVAA